MFFAWNFSYNFDLLAETEKKTLISISLYLPFYSMKPTKKYRSYFRTEAPSVLPWRQLVVHCATGSIKPLSEIFISIGWFRL